MKRQAATRQEAPQTPSIEERLDKETMVVRHMEALGKLILDPNADIRNYRLGIQHLEAMVSSLIDETYKKRVAALKMKFGKDKKLYNTFTPRHQTEAAQAYQERALARMTESESDYYKQLFKEINELCDRAGIGWTRSGLGDFEGYRRHLQGKPPGNPEEEHGIKMAQIIRERIHKENRNWLCLVIGKPGTGKSLDSYSLGQMLDPGFNLSRVVFSEYEFMKVINSNLPKGSFILADETGSWFGNRDYMSETNRMLSRLVQTFRNRNFGIFWSVPMKRMVDIHVRCLADVEIETVSLWPEVDRSMVKLKHVAASMSGIGKDRYPFQVFQTDKGPMKMIRWLIPKVPARTEKNYEKKKELWQTKDYKQMEDDMKEIGSRPRKERKILTKKEKIIKALGKGKTPKEIAKQQGTTLSYVRNVKSGIL